MRPIVIRQGDTLTKLANKYGFDAATPRTSCTYRTNRSLPTCP